MEKLNPTKGIIIKNYMIFKNKNVQQNRYLFFNPKIF